MFSEKHHRGLKAKSQPVWCARSRCILTISKRLCEMKKMKKMMPWSKLPSSRLERPARGRHKEPWCRRAETSKQKSLQHQGRVGKLEPQLTVVGGLE